MPKGRYQMPSYTKIFIPPESIEKRTCIKIPIDKSHYITSVLRHKKGDLISVIDGKGNVYEAIISNIKKRQVFIDIIKMLYLESEPTLNLILCQGILKGEKMDIVVQKATELGINAIFPVTTERCLVKETRKTNRWRKIAEESVEQCGRTIIPTIHEPVEFGTFMSHYASLKGFIFWEEGRKPLKEAVKKIELEDLKSPLYLFIGPEGGLTYEEVKTAEGKGLIRATLGKRILRAETAAIVSIALVQFIMENQIKT